MPKLTTKPANHFCCSVRQEDIARVGIKTVRQLAIVFGGERESNQECYWFADRARREAFNFGIVTLTGDRVRTAVVAEMAAHDLEKYED